MTKKRLLAALLAISMVLSNVTFVSAAEPAPFKLVVSPTEELSVGDTVEVTIVATGDSEIGNFGGVLDWNSDFFDVKLKKNGSADYTFYNYSISTFNPTSKILGWVGEDGLNYPWEAEEELGVLRFVVKAVPTSNYTFSLQLDNASDNNGVDMPWNTAVISTTIEVAGGEEPIVEPDAAKLELYYEITDPTTAAEGHEGFVEIDPEGTFTADVYVKSDSAQKVQAYDIYLNVGEDVEVTGITAGDAGAITSSVEGKYFVHIKSTSGYDVSETPLKLATITFKAKNTAVYDEELKIMFTDKCRVSLKGTAEDAAFKTGSPDTSGIMGGVILKQYTVTFNANGGEGEMDDQTFNYNVAQNLTANAFERDHYEFSGWSTTATGEVEYADEASLTLNDPDIDTLTLYAVWDQTEASYTVKHFQQNLEDDNYTEVTADKQTLDGKIGDQTEAEAKEYEGFTAQAITQGTIAADDSTVVNVYYDRDTFTVTWKDEDGTVLETDENVKYGATPSFDGTEPTKEADDQYTYAFDGWDPVLAEVTKDATYTATYTETVNKYTVTWMGTNGTAIETDKNVPYGTAPSFDGTEPTKEADAQYTYTFAGWATTANQETGTAEANLPIVSGDVTYYPAFSKTVNKYTVTWMGTNGTAIETDENVPYDTAPSFDGTEPTKEADAQYTYTFVGWATTANQETGTAEANLPTVSGDVTYYPAFSKTVNKYTITWKSQDGTQTLETDENVEYGATPSFDGTEPTKEADEQYTYTFVGWNTEVNATTGIAIPTVGGDATYYAAFSTSTQTYTITWMGTNGTAIETDKNVPYGTAPSFDGTEPTKEADAQYTYTFAGWATTANQETGTAEADLPIVSGDVTYYPAFSKTVNEYTVTWMGTNGTAIETDKNVPYGTAPSFDGTEPTKEADAQYTYTFVGWNTTADQETGTAEADLPTISGDVTYYPAFSKTVNEYTVTWMGTNGTAIETDENVPYGTEPSFDGTEPTKEADDQYTYTFVGWNTTADQETGTAEADLPIVSGDVTYYPAFSKTVNTYTIAFQNYDGTVLQSDDIEYGETPEYTGATPTKPATAEFTYEFSGWDPTIGPVTGEETYTAQFTETRIATILVEDYAYARTGEGLLVVCGTPASGSTYLYDGAPLFKIADADAEFYRPENATGDVYVTIIASADGTVDKTKITVGTGESKVIEHTGMINKDNAVSISDANAVYQMLQNRDTYTNTQIGIEQRLIADMYTKLDGGQSQFAHGSIEDVNAIVVMLHADYNGN